MKKIVLTTVATLMIGITFLPIPTFAAGYDICSDPDIAKDHVACADTETGKDKTQTNLANRVSTILNTVYLVVGILAVIFIVYAGIRYVTAVGQADKVKLAQKQLTYAIVGLIVALMAFAITRFVVARI